MLCCIQVVCFCTLWCRRLAIRPVNTSPQGPLTVLFGSALLAFHSSYFLRLTSAILNSYILHLTFYVLRLTSYILHLYWTAGRLNGWTSQRLQTIKYAASYFTLCSEETWLFYIFIAYVKSFYIHLLLYYHFRSTFFFFFFILR